ncbi:hypothetical protein Tco_0422573 [Tanacetum coccineum]
MTSYSKPSFPKLRKEVDDVQIALDRDPDLVVLHEEEAIYLNAFTQASLDEESRSRVDCVQGSDGIIHKGMNVPVVFVNHYKLFLIEESVVNPLVHEGLFSSRLNSDKASEMVRNVSNVEIKKAMFSIRNDKASGPDGYTSIITNQIKEGLNDNASINQLAFIPGRSISDNILLTQDLMHNYHSNRGPPRCAFKIDIQKAYDTLHSYFKGKRRLRQGDPMSSYLFTLVMEILTLILKRRIREDDEFKYQNRCEKQNIVNIFFVDDLILFARGDVHLTNIIMEGLEEFKGVSGLVPSIPKSTIFFCNVPDQVKTSIQQIMPFEEGKLPIKYLVVPLISSRLLHKDCKILVERVQKRIGDWKNKWLSFAGCHQLVLSIISSMHLYWASVFILPSGIIHDIEQLMCGFLWCQGDMKRGKPKVSWDDVCLPKCEGNGCKASAWFDMWDTNGPVMSHITNRAISSVGFTTRDNVANKVSDRLFNEFSVSIAWQSIRQRSNEVGWYRLVWSKYGIPRHSIHLWLIMKRRLQTQDRLSIVGKAAEMPSISPIWNNIISWLLPLSLKDNVSSIVGRLILASSAYFIWQERNNRHSKPCRNEDQVAKIIVEMVRHKLASINFKNKERVRLMKAIWKIA